MGLLNGLTPLFCSSQPHRPIWRRLYPGRCHLTGSVARELAEPLSDLHSAL
jgi:hypothetical protein